MNKTDGEVCEEDGSWDGDFLANIGVGSCQVQGEKPSRATVINEQWLVQGCRGTNPLKAKTKTVKSQKAAPSLLRSMTRRRLRDMKTSQSGSWKVV